MNKKRTGRRSKALADDLQAAEILVEARRAIYSVPRDADALDVEVWKRLAAKAWRAADLAMRAVLQARTGAVPRTSKARIALLRELSDSDDGQRRDQKLLAFCWSALDAHTDLRVQTAEHAGEHGAKFVQFAALAVEQQLLPLARRLVGAPVGARTCGSAIHVAHSVAPRAVWLARTLPLPASGVRTVHDGLEFAQCRRCTMLFGESTTITRTVACLHCRAVVDGADYCSQMCADEDAVFAAEVARRWARTARRTRTPRNPR